MANNYRGFIVGAITALAEIIQENEKLKQENEELYAELCEAYGMGSAYGCYGFEDDELNDPYYYNEQYSPYNRNKSSGTGNSRYITNNQKRYYDDDAMGISPYKLMNAISKMI